MKETRLAFLGAGNIAQAIIGGLLESGLSPAAVTAADPSDEQLAALAERGIDTTNDNVGAVEAADVIVVSVKPNVVPVLMADIAGAVESRLIISVAAGITLDTLGRDLERHAPVIRCMPNTPALVGCGMTGLVANANVTPAHRNIAESIVTAIGEFIWFENETDLDAVTAVSGSGPAYFFYVMEVMEDAGRALGLSPEVTHKLVTQTALGAATMALTSEDSPRELRHKVTSPGGTTEAALNRLEAAGLDEHFANAIQAARDRSKALSES